jgi:hypothetical protein
VILMFWVNSSNKVVWAVLRKRTVIGQYIVD